MNKGLVKHGGGFESAIRSAVTDRHVGAYMFGKSSLQRDYESMVAREELQKLHESQYEAANAILERAIPLAPPESRLVTTLTDLKDTLAQMSVSQHEIAQGDDTRHIAILEDNRKTRNVAIVGIVLAVMVPILIALVLQA